jgi:hypothetical protein
MIPMGTRCHHLTFCTRASEIRHPRMRRVGQGAREYGSRRPSRRLAGFEVVGRDKLDAQEEQECHRIGPRTLRQ